MIHSEAEYLFIFVMNMIKCNDIKYPVPVDFCFVF